MKKILRHPRATSLLAMLMAAYAKLVFLTCRVRVLTAVPPEVTRGPVFFAFWHQHLAVVPVLARPNPMPLLGLMSGSRDGAFTRVVASWFNIGAVIGSSSKGAVTGARALVQAARTGHTLFITPDGPRGPARTAKAGATEIARITRLPLIPCAAWSTRGKTFRSWDNFRLPYPFTTIRVAYGAPLRTLTPEALQQALNKLTAEAQGTAALASKPGKP